MPSHSIQQTAVSGLSFRPLFWLMLVLNILCHLLILRFVNAPWLDSDQAFMWAGVADYSKGIFREPRFYGQDYNTFIEPLFAVPFYLAGMKVQIALPLATHLLAFFPWAFASFYLYRKKEFAKATAVLAVPLCLLVAYDVLTGISRGFVGGLAFTSFFIASLHSPSNARMALTNVLFAVAGFFINPNSLLVSVPCLCYTGLHHLRDHRLLGGMCAVAAIAAVGCWLVFDRFYHLHPGYVIYSINLEFSKDHLLNNLAHIHDRLAHVSFFSASHAWFSAAAFTLLITALYIHNRKGFYASLTVPLLILAVLASNKGGDGSMWPFYSFARSFIGLPLFFALFLTLLPGRNQIAAAIVVAALVTSVFKFASFNKTVSSYFVESTWLGVHLVKTDDALHAMKVYRDACHSHGAEQLVVSNNFWLNTVLSYGGRAVYDDFPIAFETNNERRYWLREGLADEVQRKFVYVSSRNDLEKAVAQDGFLLRKLDDYGMYLVANNTLTNRQFIRLVWDAE